MPEPLSIALVAWGVITLGVLLRGVLHPQTNSLVVTLIIIGWAVFTIWLGVLVYQARNRH
jgi:hypothetical protein